MILKNFITSYVYACTKMLHTNTRLYGGLKMEFNLHGKIALISGCSQGLGYHCVLALARHGVDIFGVSIGDDSEVKKEVEAMGRQYHSLTISLTTPGAIHTLMKEVLASYTRIDILLNFAGVLKKEDTLQIKRQDWNSAFEINVGAVLALSQEVIQQFRIQGQGGKIINAGGVVPYDTNAYCAYATSKGAIMALTKYMAAEFARDQIQVNAITFGFMSCGNCLQNCTDGHDDSSILQKIPAQRWGKEGDIEGLVLLLASSYSDYICGACIPVDGGYSI